MHAKSREHGQAFSLLSCTSHSQFIEVSHPKVEAFNLDSSATQPQLSTAAAAVIIPRLNSN